MISPPQGGTGRVELFAQSPNAMTARTGQSPTKCPRSAPRTSVVFIYAELWISMLPPSRPNMGLRLFESSWSCLDGDISLSITPNQACLRLSLD